MTPVELCRVLLVGSVPAAAVPELADGGVREEVRRRLAAAGCELTYAARSDRWAARLAGSLPELDGHDPVVRLGKPELAVLAACWLHLRFLPAERARLAEPGTGPGGPGGPGGPPGERPTGRPGGQPAEQPGGPGGQPAGLVEETWLDPADLAEQFRGRLKLDVTLDRLAAAGFLVSREGQLYAGPLLDTLDEIAAAEQARALLTRHQRMAYIQRRADEISADRDADATR